MPNRKPKLEKIDIPDSARAVKGVFLERPGPAISTEIHDWVKAGNPTFNWWGHTHTRPPANAEVVYFGEFDLPDTLVKAGRLAPCPCCLLEYPKFGLLGKMAWFPAEQVVRLIGPDCFKKLSPEWHRSAEKTFREEQRRERDIQFLLGHLGKVPTAIKALREVLPVAEAYDDFRKAVRAKLDWYGINLWSEISDNRLYVTKRESEVYRARDGSFSTREIDITRPHASIVGAEFYRPRPKLLKDGINQAIAALENVVVIASADVLTDEMRRKAASLLERGMNAGRVAIQAIRTVRHGVSDPTLGTIRRWAEQEGSPLAVYIRREGSVLMIGAREISAQPVAVVPKIDGALPELPSVGVIARSKAA